MISRHLWPIVLSLGAAALSGLTGCSVAGPRQSPLPHDGPTMVDIYRQHMEEEGAPARARSGSSAGGVQFTDVVGPSDESSESTSLRDTTNPLTDRFQRLPNPDLVMHVYAHLADGKYPVPGYVTVFPMYESVQYALPGEVAPRYARAADARSGDAHTSKGQERRPVSNAANAGQISVEQSRPTAAAAETTFVKAQ